MKSLSQLRQHKNCSRSPTPRIAWIVAVGNTTAIGNKKNPTGRPRYTTVPFAEFPAETGVVLQLTDDRLHFVLEVYQDIGISRMDVEMVITKWTQVVAFVSFAVLTASVPAQQFRIESQVYSANEKAPVAESLTLYDGGYAFDFSYEPGNPGQEVEIVVFDQARKTLVLLDVKREMRLTLEQYELAKMLQELRLQLSQRKELNFLVNPQFSEKTDFASGLIELENPKMSYRATCEKPKDVASMSLYYESQDQFTWLAASDPSRLPPFSRLALNQAIKKNGLMPTEIKLHVHSDGLLQRDLELQSKHSVIWQLSVDDRKRIESAKKKWMTYATVSLGKFRGLASGATSKVAESENSETQTIIKK